MLKSAIILCIGIVLLCVVKISCRKWCPPKNFTIPQYKRIPGYKTAIISEIHGEINLPEHNFNVTQFFPGDELSRYIYFHIGVLGIDRLHLSVLYNYTLRPDGISVEDIYPPSEYCVVDWFKLGVIGWKLTPYGGPKEFWPTNRKGQPSLDRYVYKTERGHNPIYRDIHKSFDWIFVLDVDDYIIPINYKELGPKWCDRQHPTIISRVFESMLMGISKMRSLDDFASMNRTKNEGMLAVHSNNGCLLGSSHYNESCRPITGIRMPVHVWVWNNSHSNKETSSHPTIRSKFAAAYIQEVNDVEENLHNQMWKTVYQTRYNPLLVGPANHGNYYTGKEVWQVCSPREYHSVMSLELAHNRIFEQPNNRFKASQRIIAITDETMFVYDDRMVQLEQSYEMCMNSL